MLHVAVTNALKYIGTPNVHPFAREGVHFYYP